VLILEYIGYVLLYGYVVLGAFYIASKFYQNSKIIGQRNFGYGSRKLDTSLSYKLDLIFTEYKIKQIE
jgi:hypothetical protein